MTWKNVGDINPREGGKFVRNPEIGASGNFTAECIETINETTVGGDEKRILIRQGIVFLVEKNFQDALDTVGARLVGDEIVRPGHYGEEERFPISSEEGLIEMFHAAHAYGGIDDLDLQVVVQIGEDEVYDQEKRFGDEVTVYPYESSIWAIIERETNGFDMPHGKPPAEPLPAADEPRP